MDCHNARLLLDFARPVPSELAANERAELEHHLEECPVCSGLDQEERALDAAIRPAMLDVSVPQGLQTRLMTRLSVERDAWYRKVFVRVSAVAALFVVGIGLAVWYATLPTELDTTTIVDMFQRKPEFVNGWLRESGYRDMKAPPQFRYSYLTGVEVARLQGHNTPMLMFTRETDSATGMIAEFAKVYILSDDQFNLTSLRAKQFEDSNALLTKMKVLDHPEDPHLVYFVVYTGDLDQFFADEK